MAESKTVVDALPVRELRDEVPREYDGREHRPLPRDRRGTYFVGVSD